MFDRIASRYDLMNSLMTGWQDERWRRAAASAAAADGVCLALDAATGTGGLALALRRAGAAKVIGVDTSSGMLERAATRVKASGEISLRWADVMDLPFEDDTFDACTIGFGLRNLSDYRLGVQEMVRVIGPGGRLVILELTPGARGAFGRLFDFYFGRMVPLLGWVVSGDLEAYRYLPESVRAFPDARTLARIMNDAGLVDLKWRHFGGGTVALHVGRKPGRDDHE